jgi:hypothetical protein
VLGSNVSYESALNIVPEYLSIAARVGEVCICVFNCIHCIYLVQLHLRSFSVTEVAMCLGRGNVNKVEDLWWFPHSCFPSEGGNKKNNIKFDKKLKILII